MKYKFLNKLGINVCLLTIMTSSSLVMANPLKQDLNVINNGINLDIPDISVFAVYDHLKNHELSSGTSFSTSLNLSNVVPYGKVFYTNNSNASINIVVKDKDGKNVTSKTVSKNSNGSCTWKGDGLYSISITVSGGSENLNGLVSTGVSDESFK